MGNENVVCIHVDVYPAIKKNEMMTFFRKRMKIENITFGDIKVQKDKYAFLLACGPQTLISDPLGLARAGNG